MGATSIKSQDVIIDMNIISGTRMNELLTPRAFKLVIIIFIEFNTLETPSIWTAPMLKSILKEEWKSQQTKGGSRALHYWIKNFSFWPARVMGLPSPRPGSWKWEWPWDPFMRAASWIIKCQKIQSKKREYLHRTHFPGKTIEALIGENSQILIYN